MICIFVSVLSGPSGPPGCADLARKSEAKHWRDTVPSNTPDSTVITMNFLR